MKNVFLAYTFDDTNVAPLNGVEGETSVKDYADVAEKALKGCKFDIAEVFRCKEDKEDLTGKTWVNIWNDMGVKELVYDTAASVIMISPATVDPKRPAEAQWTPWNMYFSVHRIARKDGNIAYNPVVLVVLPDKNGSTAYFDQDKTFDILKKNIENDYVYLTDWKMFSKYPDMCINVAEQHKDATDPYKVCAVI